MMTTTPIHFQTYNSYFEFLLHPNIKTNWNINFKLNTYVAQGIKIIIKWLRVVLICVFAWNGQLQKQHKSMPAKKTFWI